MGAAESYTKAISQVRIRGACSPCAARAAFTHVASDSVPHCGDTPRPTLFVCAAPCPLSLLRGGAPAEASQRQDVALL